jgi:hypothetical protein
VRDQRLAVGLHGDHRLDLGFADMHLDAHIEFPCQDAAADQEIVGAVMGNGRPQRGTDASAVELPAFQDAAARRIQRLVVRALDGQRLPAERLR